MRITQHYYTIITLFAGRRANRKVMDVVKQDVDLISEEVNELNGGGWLAHTSSGSEQKEGVSFAALLCNLVDLETF